MKSKLLESAGYKINVRLMKRKYIMKYFSIFSRELASRLLDIQTERDRNEHLLCQITRLEREIEVLKSILKHSEKEEERLRTELISAYNELRLEYLLLELLHMCRLLSDLTYMCYSTRSQWTSFLLSVLNHTIIFCTT